MLKKIYIKNGRSYSATLPPETTAWKKWDFLGDRTNPLDKFDDLELFRKFRFRRANIIQMTDELKEELEDQNWKGALPPVLQVVG